MKKLKKEIKGWIVLDDNNVLGIFTIQSCANVLKMNKERETGDHYLVIPCEITY